MESKKPPAFDWRDDGAAQPGPDVFKTPSAEEEAAGMVECLQRGCAWYNVRRERCSILERIA